MKAKIVIGALFIQLGIILGLYVAVYRGVYRGAVYAVDAVRDASFTAGEIGTEIVWYWLTILLGAFLFRFLSHMGVKLCKSK
jgi:hypothetical protein